MYDIRFSSQPANIKRDANDVVESLADDSPSLLVKIRQAKIVSPFAEVLIELSNDAQTLDPSDPGAYLAVGLPSKPSLVVSLSIVGNYGGRYSVAEDSKAKGWKNDVVAAREALLIEAAVHKQGYRLLSEQGAASLHFDGKPVAVAVPADE